MTCACTNERLCGLCGKVVHGCREAFIPFGLGRAHKACWIAWAAKRAATPPSS